MAQNQLDLFKLAARSSAQLSAGAAEVVGRYAGNANPRCMLLEHLPYDLFAQTIARRAVRVIYGSEDMPILSCGSCLVA
jgi:hypothetical protein